MIRYTIVPAILAAGFVLPANVGNEVEEFDEASVFIEINATDEDAGFQGIVDGEPWSKLSLFTEDGEPLFKYSVQRAAKAQGFTEFSWESAEPTFDELSLEVFLSRFPPGEYTFKAKTLEGSNLESTVELTHHLPDGPEITSPEEDEVVDPDEDMPISWNAVLTQYDQDGIGMGPPLLTPIVKYTVTVESDDDGDDKVMDFDVLSGTSATCPAAFLDADRHWKVEIGAFEESGNSTFRELPFCTHDEEECPDDEE